MQFMGHEPRGREAALGKEGTRRRRGVLLVFVSLARAAVIWEKGPSLEDLSQS